MNKMRNNKKSLKNEYDIVIIGAGPAGCSIANFLSNKYHILMVDFLNFPRNKSCGGVLVEESQDFIKNWKIPNNVFSCPKYLNMKMIDWNNDLEVDVKRKLWNITRKDFDYWLLQRINKNIDFFSSTKLLKFKNYQKDIRVFLEIEGKVKIIKAKYLIGANGAFSNVRKSLIKKPVRYYTAIQYWIKQNSKNNIGENTYFIYDNEITDFYSWLIPKKDKLILGSALEKGVDIESKMNLFVRKLKEKHEISGKCIKKESAILSRIRNKKDICLGDNKVFLVGEAAGFISSSTGEGISFALRSGYNCAKAINKDFNRPIPLYKKYSKDLIKEASDKIKKADKFSSIKERKKVFKEFKN